MLNGSGRVGDAARARVLAAVEALGYHPHHGARSLRSRRTRQFAYVMPQVQLLPGNYIMQQFLQSLAAACARRSYSLVTVVPDGDPRDEMRRLIASRSVDGFLLSELQQDDARVKLLAEARMPFACFGRTGPAQPQNWVDIDNRGAVAAAVAHVRARGFGRIAFVGYRTPNYWDTERVAGFRDGLAASGVSADQADVLLVDDASARRKIRSLLSAGRPELRPDALVTSSDRLAGVVYSVAAELRLRIGQDLAVTGFDGSAAAALMHPRLTTVAIPVDDIARQVVARALRQLDHGAGQEPGELVPATLRLGDSTGGPGREPDGPGREPDEPAARSEDDAAPIWKRFQGSSPPAGGPVADRRVTIADVAADAGVGVGTVSRVLNGSDQVRESTMRAVLDSIDRLGYRPSYAAAALVRGSPRTVALIVAHMTRPSSVVRVASALAVLEEQGYDAIVYNVDSPAERDRHLEALLPTQRADGVLAICLPLSRGQLGQFARAGVAVVSVDAANPGVPQTIVDDVASGRLATGHLVALGHRRIGFVGDMTSGKPPAGLGFTSSADRQRGYQRGPGRGRHRCGERPDPARPARHRGRGRARGAAAEVARSPVGDLRRLRHPGHRGARRGGPAWRGGTRRVVGRRLRRHRVGDLPRPQHGASAADPLRGRGGAAAVRGAARRAGQAAAAGTADRADGTGQFGAGAALARYGRRGSRADHFGPALAWWQPKWILADIARKDV